MGWQGKARPVCKCQNNVRLRGKLPLSRVTPALGFVIWTQLECYKYNILWLSDVTPANSENLWHWQNMKGVNKTSTRKHRVLSKSPFWHYLAWQRKRYFTALTQFKKCKCNYCHAVCTCIFAAYSVLFLILALFGATGPSSVLSDIDNIHLREAPPKNVFF